MAPVTQWLIEHFGWRGCVLMLAGFTLNCAVFGSLFRPYEVSKNDSQNNKPLLLRIKEAREALWTESDEEGDEETMSPTASQNSAPPPYCEVVNLFNDKVDNELSSLKPSEYSSHNHNDNVSFRRRTKSAIESKN